MHPLTYPFASICNILHKHFTRTQTCFLNNIVKIQSGISFSGQEHTWTKLPSRHCLCPLESRPLPPATITMDSWMETEMWPSFFVTLIVFQPEALISTTFVHQAYSTLAIRSRHRDKTKPHSHMPHVASMRISKETKAANLVRGGRRNHLKITNISQHIKKTSLKFTNSTNMPNLKELSGWASCRFIYSRMSYVQFDPLQASTGCMWSSRQQASSVESEYFLWCIGGLWRVSIWNEGCVPLWTAKTMHAMYISLPLIRLLLHGAVWIPIAAVLMFEKHASNFRRRSCHEYECYGSFSSQSPHFSSQSFHSVDRRWDPFQVVLPPLVQVLPLTILPFAWPLLGSAPRHCERQDSDHSPFSQ